MTWSHTFLAALFILSTAVSYGLQPLPWRRACVLRAMLWWRYLRRSHFRREPEG